MINSPATILPSTDFDTGMMTAVRDVASRMTAIMQEAADASLDLADLVDCACTSAASHREAETRMKALRDAAALLFLQWQRAGQHDDKLDVLAYARLFNSITRRARDLDARFDLIDKQHLRQLEERLLGDAESDDAFDPMTIAQAMEDAATARRHEQAWAWVVLPTFARQPYGRILLLSVQMPHRDCRIFVTQPFFLAGKSTMFHTHGRNWAFARPLGPSSGSNAHINTLWQPRTPAHPFPLTQLDYTEYTDRDVVVIPPCVLHGISRRRTAPEDILPMRDLIRDEERLATTRFGELACLHIYRPHKPLVEKMEDCPILEHDDRFFMENDMIVFDHQTESIWSGGGGSWPRRMIEFGATGDHCGICYEDDPRRENLDPKLVYDWFIADPPPQVMMYQLASDE